MVKVPHAEQAPARSGTDPYAAGDALVRSADPYARSGDPYARPGDPYAGQGYRGSSSAPPLSSAPPPPGYGHPPPHPGYGHPPAGFYAPPGYAPPPHPGYPPPHHGYPPPHGYGHPPHGYPPPGYYPPPAYAYHHPVYGGYPPPSYRSRSRSRSRSRDGDSGKYMCTFYIGIENDEEFHVGKRIIGQGGVNMKDIVKRAGIDAKLRLRGKGSGFVEHSTNKESQEPLQLCISCTDSFGYHTAIQCVDSLLRRVYADYDKWCLDEGLPHRAPQIHMRERNGGRDSGGGSSKRTGNGNGKKRRAKVPADEGEDKGEPPPGAPSVEEIERLIQERNEARRSNNYKLADEIRNGLQAKQVVLQDEKGAHGNASSVTTWRYWKE